MQNAIAGPISLTAFIVQMLELYYHLHDDESQKAMMALANHSIIRGNFGAQYSPFEGDGTVKNRENIASSTSAEACDNTVFNNGEGGIRTRGTRKGHTGFRNRLDKPLRHLSITAPVTYTLNDLKLQEY